MKKKKPGFTLIEIIIALAVTVIVLEISVSMFITGNKVFSDSDVKSTLQIEGQAIQEKISDIGMQATEIKSVNGDELTNEIEDIVINSYYQTTEAGASFEIKKREDSSKTYKDTSKMYQLWINDKLISSNVKSLKIDNNIITADETTLKNINSIEFNILLRKEKGYSDIDYPINFKVTFRNKDD